MLLLAVSLSGCQYDVLHPSGWVAGQERNLLIISTLLMLIVIIPVIFMGVYFPWKYRADRPDKSDYEPDFAHSNKLEVLIWSAPVAIVIALGVFTWIYTHRLDPYRPLDLAHAGEPIEVEAVSLDWKWLFIYPQYGVASVNELAIPVNRPVNFRLTSSTVMNTLSIPALSGMVYSMAGMETRIHMIADEVGTFAGRSAHYSGPGFSQMTFDTDAMSDADFDAWVSSARAEGTALTRDAYLALEKPSIGNPVTLYTDPDPELFERIVGLCVEEGKVCMDQMMMTDMHGGGGLAGIGDKAAYEYDGQRMIDGFGNLMQAPGAGLIDGNDDTGANDAPDVQEHTRSAPAMEHN
ncbi:ubiquinol oxidase subunit II [Pseudooceanicola sediminis]|uniref:Ubiquinol oxidase subunit 2 n=1 Tax=Pseudooceanicola sediminis TaxID=2211117 RepID=A0A399J6G4_9RHOB|nr:ubiquinol oxidase subunit II [Pseudooceanicola sediminis]KAA2317194.1 ubiquinol oxidase subunit II [Puniceibacterium sp. HSS470]RII40790.1 ubiquinol oxidase subunit II [Pseudooceanicola sediminis]|tara:strand:- start:33247 stop:34296 length:1050 start_codon:yes stop_codon:yes gene_type:complete